MEVTEECSSDEDMVEMDTDDLVECDEETEEIMTSVFGQVSESGLSVDIPTGSYTWLCHFQLYSIQLSRLFTSAL